MALRFDPGFANPVTITKDIVSEVFASLQDLVGNQVLIGFPESADARQDGDPMNNAALAYVHEFGSPAANIPARPFLIPGVDKATDPALVQMRAAADAALVGDTAKADQALQAAGIIGANFARNEINSGNFVPLAPSTIRNRHRSRGTASMRKSEKQYMQLVDSGMSPADAQAATGIKPLINTSQLRNSITSVVRKI
jgi:hypothetical protein